MVLARRCTGIALCLLLLIACALPAPGYTAPDEPARGSPAVLELAHRSSIARDNWQRLDLARAALVAAQARSDLEGEVHARLALVEAFQRLGRPEGGLAHAKRAAALASRYARLEDRRIAQYKAGVLCQDCGRHTEAARYYRQALRLYRQNGDRRGSAEILGRLAAALVPDSPREAAALAEEAIWAHRYFDGSGDENWLRSQQAAACMEARQYDRAIATFQQVLKHAAADHRPDGEGQTLHHLAQIAERRGNSAEAIDLMLQAVQKMEQWRSPVSVWRAGATFVPGITDTHFAAVAMLVDHERPRQALEVLEKTRGRALLDTLSTPRIDLASALPEAQTATYRALRARADELNAQAILESIMDAPGARKRVADLEAAMARADRELRDAADALGRAQPALDRVTKADTLSIGAIGYWVPDDTALIEYSVASVHTGKTTLARVDRFVLTSGKGGPRVTAHTLSVSPTELARRVRALRSACAFPAGRIGSRARELYDLLIRPIERQLAGKRRLLICPDGVLWDLPFAVLRDRRGRLLVDRYEVAYGISATVEHAAFAARDRMSPQRWIRTAVAFANPHLGPLASLQRTAARPIPAPARTLGPVRGGRIAWLPGAAREAQAVARTFPSSIAVTGIFAREEAARRELAGCRYLHFATHGFYNRTVPLQSCLMLAQPDGRSSYDGFLTAREILDMRLSAEMVVLSACNTARGEKRTGEGLVGLTWALFAAGVPTQVLAQWAVDDEAAATLMTSFYAGIKAGKPKGTALREAALALKNDGKHGHPYYWAPWVLMGDWR